MGAATRMLLMVEVPRSLGSMRGWNAPNRSGIVQVRIAEYAQASRTRDVAAGWAQDVG